MSQVVILQISPIGEDVVAFDFFSNADSFAVPFEQSVPRSLVLTGFTSSLVPASATQIRALSVDGPCVATSTIPIDTSGVKPSGTIEQYWVLNACNPLYPAASTQIPPTGLNQRYIIPNVDPIFYVWNNQSPTNYPLQPENKSLQRTPFFGCP